MRVLDSCLSLIYWQVKTYTKLTSEQISQLRDFSISVITLVKDAIVLADTWMVLAPFLDLSGEEVHDRVPEVVSSNEVSEELGTEVGAEETPDLHLWEVAIEHRVASDGLELEDDGGGGDVESVEASEGEEHTEVEVGGGALVDEGSGPEGECHSEGDELAPGHGLPCVLVPWVHQHLVESWLLPCVVEDDWEGSLDEEGDADGGVAGAVIGWRTDIVSGRWGCHLVF